LSNKELLSNRNRWHKNLKKDIFISEGVNVLEQIFSQDKARTNPYDPSYSPKGPY